LLLMLVIGGSAGDALGVGLHDRRDNPVAVADRGEPRCLGVYSITWSARASFGQPGFAKALNQQLRVFLPAPRDPRRYCKSGIELKQARSRLTRLSIASKVGEGGRETAVTYRIGGVLTKGFLPCDDCLVKAMKLNKGISHPIERIV
jgi:hypothetical protein